MEGGEGQAGDHGGAVEGWVVAEAGRAECEWAAWSDTTVTGHVTLAGARVRVLTGAGAGGMAGASAEHRSTARTQASHGTGAGGEPLPMLVWGCLDMKAGCEAREDVGLTLKVESDGLLGAHITLGAPAG